jgi:hypothetical protein
MMYQSPSQVAAETGPTPTRGRCRRGRPSTYWTLAINGKYRRTCVPGDKRPPTQSQTITKWYWILRRRVRMSRNQTGYEDHRSKTGFHAPITQ